MRDVLGNSRTSLEFDERIVPDETDQGIVSVHLKRYVFASPLCRSKQVLDVACGTGYGTYYLAAFVERVVGVDRSQEAIAYAKRRYGDPKAEFYVMDACELAFQHESFDLVCSFETIEHLGDVGAYLKGVVRVLRPDGLYLVSTPCVKRSTRAPQNPFHTQEWSPRDFKALLETRFASVRLFGQRRRQSALHRFLQRADMFHLHTKISFPAFTKRLSRAVGTTPFADMSLEDLEIIENHLQGAMWMVGICSGPRKMGRESL